MCQVGLTEFVDVTDFSKDLDLQLTFKNRASYI